MAQGSSSIAGGAPDVESDCRSFLRHGALMTLLGPLSGFTPIFAKAPTAALEAHTIGVLQGALLFGMASAWPFLRTSSRARSLIRISLLIGLYSNWLGAQLAGLWSAKSMFVVSGAAMPAGAARWMEGVVAVLLNVSILVVVSCVAILWVSRRGATGTGQP